VKREILPLLIIALMFAIALYTEPYIITNEKGEVMGFGGFSIQSGGWMPKSAGLYLIPVLTCIIYLGLSLIPKIEVYHKNLEDFSDQFWGFKVVLVFAMCVIYIATLLPNLGFWGVIDPMLIVIPAVSMLFFYVGYMLNFTKRNYFIGIGTPWTLADEKVWKKTNHLGSRLFWLLGVVALALLVAPINSALWIIIALLGIVLAALYVYSLLEYFKIRKIHDARRKRKK